MTGLLQALVGLSFAVSVFSKVRSRGSWDAFVVAVQQVVGASLRPRAAAPVVTAVEALVVVLVVVPATSTWGFALASLLLVAFCAAIARVVATGRTAVCRCFGLSERPLSPVHLARNAILLAVAVAGLVLPGTGQVALGPSEWFVGGLLVVAATAFIATFDELVSVFFRIHR